MVRYKLTVKNELARAKLADLEMENKKVFDWLLNGEPKYSEEFVPETSGYKILLPLGGLLNADTVFLAATLVTAEAFEEARPGKRRGYVIKELWAFCTVDPKDGHEGIMSASINGFPMPLICSDRDRYLSLIPLAKDIAKTTNLKVTIKHYTYCHSHSLEQDPGGLFHDET